MIDESAVIASAANSVHRRFRSYVDREDLVSEGWVWSLSHGRTLDAYLKDEDTKRAEYRLRRDLSMAMETYSRREKAVKVGYNVDDEQFYNAALVAVMLPAVVEGDYEQARGGSDEPRGHTDPAEGGTWLAARADVSRAWDLAELTATQRATLVDYYVNGLTEDEIARARGVSQPTISEHLSSGIRKLVNHLGGTKPRGCPYDCECHEGKLRLRPGTHSNLSGQNQNLD